MRNLIDLITEASFNEDFATARTKAGFAPAPKQYLHLRIYRQMQKVAGMRPTDEASATTLLQELEELKAAIREFGARQGGEMNQKIHEVLSHLMMYLPKDGDIEGVLANPEEVQSEIVDGMKFLHKQLKHEGVMVEGKE